ncbi:MAG: HAMP domain-containing protein [Deltaproteobacteria bacterium]|nr:HAMP domain-containing protein [Deltaproteobacteria bacterium]
MRSIRVKLIAVVLLIAFSGLAAVVLSSLTIVRDSQHSIVENANIQVSDLVSKSILAQISEYRRKIEFVFNSWKANPSVKIEQGLFPDYLWVGFYDAKGKSVFEWSADDKLKEQGLSRELLIGYKNRDELFQEIKRQVLGLKVKKNTWMIFNSSIKTLFPTFLLATALFQPAAAEGEDEILYVGFAEIQAERLYASIQARRGQELTLIDSHQNVLLSTREKWDPSEIVFNDDEVMKAVGDLKLGKPSFVTLDYPKEESKFTSLYKFEEGGGLTLVLQEPFSGLRSGEKQIQTRSMMIALIVLIFTVNLLIFFGNSITAPLLQLMKMMEKAGKGEFTGRIKVASKDEIGRLATMFNKMLNDLREREDEIENAKSRLIQSEKMSAFGQMSAGIAHEVKNPLAGILGYAQMSKKKLDASSEVLPYVEIIEKEALRCKEIVENLMRFARQEKANLTRIDINKAVKDSVRLVEHQMSISGIKLVQMFALEGAPIWIKGNSNQVQQVMMNLMLNAQQAMENKGSLTVSTHYDQENQKVLIMVSDTGMGMSDEVKARIFEPFYTTKGVGKGTGLGLSVSIGIIKDHGGNIEVESSPGKGTTFTITLPCDTQEAEAPPTENVA